MSSKKLDQYTSELEDQVFELGMLLKKQKENNVLQKEAVKKTMGKLIHNLKNPVGAVLSFSEMMKEGYDSYDEEKFKKHLDVINNSAKFSIELLNRFGKFFQYQTDSIEYEFLPINILEIIYKVIERVSPFASSKNIHIEFSSELTNYTLQLDREQAINGFEEILHNAIRYSNQESIVTIKITQNEEYLSVSIQDNGIGIPTEKLPQITQEFFVVNTYDSEKRKCIGLGLTIAQTILKKHNATLNFISEEGKGTICNISFAKG